MKGPSSPFLTIAEAARLIAAKKLSPVELVRSLLARVEAIDPKVNAFLTVTGEQALAAARAAERRVRAPRKSRLLGIPLAHKDIYETAGIRTTAHSRLLADHVPQADAEAIRRLREAGAVTLGKLATHEFAIGGPSFDLPWPPRAKPLGFAPVHRRIEFRLGGRDRGRTVPRLARFGYRRLDPRPASYWGSRG